MYLNVNISPTVDGRNPANQLRLVVYPIIYRVLYIPGGCLGFLPSTVSFKFLSKVALDLGYLSLVCVFSSLVPTLW